MSRRGLYRSAQILCLILTLAAAANAQTVVYDWSSNSKVPESYPQIRRKQIVWFRITNVNDILFSYRLEVTQTPIAGHDFDYLAGIFKHFRGGGARALNPQACPALQSNAEDSINVAIGKISADPKLPVQYAKIKPHVSVPLDDSVNAWKKYDTEIDTALGDIARYRQRCNGQNPQVDSLFLDVETRIKKLDAIVNGDHVFVDKHEISPGNDVSVAVVEMYEGVPIKTKTFTFPGVDVLTLSAGALFSKIPDRTYDARKSPLSELNVLTVEGNSRATPSIAALLNYSLGSIKLDSENFGLALSAGPVLRLGNKSEASSFGFFSGISGHLYHRFYITPGFHFGQFADFPVGFNNGSTVPANFGTLTPVKRWTARFGLALTFKTKDFSGLTDSDEPEVTGGEAGGSSTEESSSSSTPSERNSDIARDFLRRPAPPRSTEAPVEVSEPIREPVTAPEQPRPNSDSFRARETPAPASPYLVSSSASSSLTHVTSINNNKAGAGSERLFLAAAGPIRDYAVQFKNGRFFLSLPHTRLDIMEEGLSGEMYQDAVFEQRGDVLVVSFALMPATKARVEEHANGLVVTFLSGSKD